MMFQYSKYLFIFILYIYIYVYVYTIYLYFYFIAIDIQFQSIKPPEKKIARRPSNQKLSSVDSTKKPQ